MQTRGGAVVDDKTLPVDRGGEKGDVDDLIFSTQAGPAPSSR